MKVQNITDVEGFFKVVDSCKGRVELVTGEGDRLNLKSKLSQYVSMANIFSNGEIPELEVIAYEKEDTSLTFHAHSFLGFLVFFIHPSHLLSFVLLKRNTIRLSTPVMMNRNTDNAPPIP